MQMQKLQIPQKTKNLNNNTLQFQLDGIIHQVVLLRSASTSK